MKWTTATTLARSESSENTLSCQCGCAVDLVESRGPHQTRDKEGETPIDIARRSGACVEIIGLLSLTPEEVRFLGGEEMARLYAPVTYWQDAMYGWITSRSWADCQKFINEHDDELVREVACNS